MEKDLQTVVLPDPQQMLQIFFYPGSGGQPDGYISNNVMYCDGMSPELGFFNYEAYVDQAGKNRPFSDVVLAGFDFSKEYGEYVTAFFQAFLSESTSPEAAAMD